MTEQLERLVEPTQAVQIPTGAVAPTQSSEPVLITEAEVVFSTAAALRPATTGWRSRVSAVWQTLAVWNYELSKPKPRPKRLWYLEDARMQREMERL